MMKVVNACDGSFPPAIRGPILIPAAETLTNNADAFVIVWYDTQAEISCLFTTSALPKPHKTLPSNATFIESYVMATEYMLRCKTRRNVSLLNTYHKTKFQEYTHMFPINGHRALNARAVRNEEFLYHNE
jgi:hypothetical protein